MSTVVSFKSRKERGPSLDELEAFLLRDEIPVVLANAEEQPWILGSTLPSEFAKALTWNMLRDNPLPELDDFASIWLADTPEMRTFLHKKVLRPLRLVVIPDLVYDALSYPQGLSDSGDPKYAPGEWFSASFIIPTTHRIEDQNGDDVEDDIDPEDRPNFSWASDAAWLWQELRQWSVFEEALLKAGFKQVPPEMVAHAQVLEAKAPVGNRFFMTEYDWAACVQNR